MKRIDDEFDNFLRIIKVIAMQFGQNCEVVLHDFSKPFEQTIVAIENGHVSGRNVGDCGTHLGLAIMQGVLSATDVYNNISHLKNGTLIRTSSIFIRDEDGKPIGSICINFDISNLTITENIIRELVYSTKQPDDAGEQNGDDEISYDVNELLDKLLQESLQFVKVPINRMVKEDKIKVLDYLDKKGAFMIKKAGDKVSQILGISRFSLYNYLEEGRSRREEPEA